MSDISWFDIQMLYAEWRVMHPLFKVITTAGAIVLINMLLYYFLGDKIKPY